MEKLSEVTCLGWDLKTSSESLPGFQRPTLPPYEEVAARTPFWGEGLTAATVLRWPVSVLERTRRSSSPRP